MGTAKKIEIQNKTMSDFNPYLCRINEISRQACESTPLLVVFRTLLQLVELRVPIEQSIRMAAVVYRATIACISEQRILFATVETEILPVRVIACIGAVCRTRMREFLQVRRRK
jgi:hypothetical protein